MGVTRSFTRVNKTSGVLGALHYQQLHAFKRYPKRFQQKGGWGHDIYLALFFVIWGLLGASSSQGSLFIPTVLKSVGYAAKLSCTRALSA